MYAKTISLEEGGCKKKPVSQSQTGETGSSGVSERTTDWIYGNIFPKVYGYPSQIFGLFPTGQKICVNQGMHADGAYISFNVRAEGSVPDTHFGIHICGMTFAHTLP